MIEPTPFINKLLRKHYKEGKSNNYLKVDDTKIYFTYGIEFEMININPDYSNDAENDDGDGVSTQWKHLADYGDVGTDGSLYSDGGEALEFRTPPMCRSREQLRGWLKEVFYTNYRLVQRGTFNDSTGMHIHIKTSYEKPSKRTNNRDSPRYRAVEYNVGLDSKVINSVTKSISKNCKIETIQKCFRRKYTNGRGNYRRDRYKQINVTNGKGYGTVEYRLFNLRGINNYSEFEDAVIHQVELLLAGTILMLKRAARGKTFSVSEELTNDVLETKLEAENEVTDYAADKGEVTETLLEVQ